MTPKTTFEGSPVLEGDGQATLRFLRTPDDVEEREFRRGVLVLPLDPPFVGNGPSSVPIILDDLLITSTSGDARLTNEVTITLRFGTNLRVLPPAQNPLPASADLEGETRRSLNRLDDLVDDGKAVLEKASAGMTWYDPTDVDRVVALTAELQRLSESLGFIEDLIGNSANVDPSKRSAIAADVLRELMFVNELGSRAMPGAFGALRKTENQARADEIRARARATEPEPAVVRGPREW